jgi:uncharacterized OsmC-like protein
MPKKTVDITASAGESYEIDLKTRHFSLKIDQPKPSGKDSAPTPLEYFLFALGGCMCTIGKTIAEQRKIALKAIEAKISGDIDTDFLLGKTKEGRAGFTEIKMELLIDAPISQQEKEALAKEIEARCPLSDNIQEKTKMKIEVK